MKGGSDGRSWRPFARISRIARVMYSQQRYKAPNQHTNNQHSRQRLQPYRRATMWFLVVFCLTRFERHNGHG